MLHIKLYTSRRYTFILHITYYCGLSVGVWACVCVCVSVCVREIETISYVKMELYHQM